MTNFEEDSYGKRWDDYFWLRIGILIWLGVTVPLITNDQGEKLGKSVGNALWLDENLSTPYECYQVQSIEMN